MRGIYEFLISKGIMVAFGLGLAVTLIFLGIAFGGLDDFNAMGKDDRYVTTIFNFGLYASIAMIILCALAMVAFGVFHIVSDLKGSIKGIAGMAGIVVLFFVAQSMAGSDPAWMKDNVIDKFGISDGESAIINGAIISSLSLLALSAIAFVGSELRNFFN